MSLGGGRQEHATHTLASSTPSIACPVAAAQMAPWKIGDSYTVAAGLRDEARAPLVPLCEFKRIGRNHLSIF